MRISHTRLVSLLIVSLVWTLPTLALAAEEAVRGASATLPLDEVLELHRKLEAAEQPAEPAPPIAASVARAALAGRLLDDAIELEASFVVDVLESERWVSVTLLRKRSSTHIAELPTVQGANLVVRDGLLQLVTRKSGRYRFNVTLLERATREGSSRRASIQPGDPSLASLELSFDTDLFRLESEGAFAGRDGVTILPEAGQLAVAWSRLGAPPESEAGPAPSAAPVITTAHASSVSTLEGQRITRVLYELRFSGNPRIALQIPDGQTVTRMYRNGVPIAGTSSGSALELDVKPARAGDERGTLELVLTSTEPSFNLSGSLDFELPRAGWPTNELYLDVHLPQVFDYSWRAGSLAEVESSPASRFSHQLPLPGKALRFHQYLVGAAAPGVTLDYTVNLDGHYFRR
jgi:hypothetical protein